MERVINFNHTVLRWLQACKNANETMTICGLCYNLTQGTKKLAKIATNLILSCVYYDSYRHYVRMY